MSKAKRSASAPKTDRSSGAFWRFTFNVIVCVCVAGAMAALCAFCKDYVDQHLAFPTRPPRVVLGNQPPWMSDFLAEQIIKNAQPIGLHSAYDHQLLVDTANALRSNPWIKQIIQVRRTFDKMPGDTVEIDCEYRVPAALVKWDQHFWLVDGDGVKLPEEYTADQLPKIIFGADGKVNVRIIDGVSHVPPESARVWPGEDLAGGLEVAKLLEGQPYAEQIREIDVTNFDGRHDRRAAQIVLITKFGTQIRWGRPPSAKDAFAEVPAATKLAAIKEVFNQTQRVDAGQTWIDIRFDRVTRPGPTPDQHSASMAGN